jgi:hypothetical protein
MIDLTDALTGMDLDPYRDHFDRPSGDWTPERLRGWLDEHKIDHHPTQKPNADGGLKYSLTACPCCGQSEGSPAAWVADGNPVYVCHRANKCGATWRTLETHFHKSKLPTISAFDLPTRFPTRRPDVIAGLLRRGDVANIVGGPKARKSFFVAQIALSVAAGVPLLGRWPTTQGQVLLVDNELRPDDLRDRLRAMVAAMGLDWGVTKNITIMPLRGQLADVHAIRKELATIPADTYSLVILDALYKAIPDGADENSNSNMTQVYCTLDAAAESQNCGTIAVHHTSKGTQSQKSVTDVGAGAGAQSRSADLHATLRDHEDSNCVVLQAVVRSQKPIEPVVLTFDYPLWKVADDKDPAQLATPNKKPALTMEQLLAAIPNDPTPKKELEKTIHKATGAALRGIAKLMEDAETRGLVAVEKGKNANQKHTIRKVTP